MWRLIEVPMTGAVGFGISLGSGKSLGPSPAASAITLKLILSPDVLYYGT